MVLKPNSKFLLYSIIVWQPYVFDVRPNLSKILVLEISANWLRADSVLNPAASGTGKFGVGLGNWRSASIFVCRSGVKGPLAS